MKSLQNVDVNSIKENQDEKAKVQNHNKMSIKKYT